MASRKRPRENDLSDADLEQKDITLEELPPVKKKTIITDGDPILEQEIHKYLINSDSSISTDGHQSQTHWEAIWRHFSVYCNSIDLMSLRRVCRRFHAFVGPSFLALSRFRAFPEDYYPLDQVWRSHRIADQFRNARESFRSIPAADWNFWCSQVVGSIEDTLEKTNIELLHLSTGSLLPGTSLQCFPRLHTLTMDYLMALSSFKSSNYELIQTISVFSPREQLASQLYQQLRRADNLAIDFSQPHDISIFAIHFAHLLSSGFTSLQKISLSLNHWTEIKPILEALAQRSSQPVNNVTSPHALPNMDISTPISNGNNSNETNSNLSTQNGAESELQISRPSHPLPLTHLMISLPQNAPFSDCNVDLALAVITQFASLTHLWLDKHLPISTEIENLDLGLLEVAHFSLSADPPHCLALGGKYLRQLSLTIGQGSVVTLDPTCNNLNSLQLFASIQAVSMMLESHAPPALHTINFEAILSEQLTMPKFELKDISSLTALNATFIASQDGFPLILFINGSNLRTIALDVAHNILVSGLILDPGMNDSLNILTVAHMASPRASARNVVEIPFLPQAISKIQIPAHWIANSGPNEPLDMTGVTEHVNLACFRLNDKFGVSNLLYSMSLNVLSSMNDLVEQLTELIPTLPRLQECLIRLLAPERELQITEPLPLRALRSDSLRLLNLKLLPRVYSKPSPPNNAAAVRSASTASALDPSLVFALPGQAPLPLGKSKCTVENCKCSGYTRDTVRTQGVLPRCITPLCGHGAPEHQPAADLQSHWLSISLDCPLLTHLALGGLCSMMQLNSLLRSSPLLTHLQVSLSKTIENVTIAHQNLTTLHLARIESMQQLYLNCPKLVRFFGESCPSLTSVVPFPTPLLEVVYLISTPLTPESRFSIQRAGLGGQTSIIMSYPNKAWFPDLIPHLDAK